MNRLQELAGINELGLNHPISLKSKMLVLISCNDGLIIDYSFDTSQSQKQEFIRKHNLDHNNDIELDDWFITTTLEELLNGRLKSRHQYDPC